MGGPIDDIIGGIRAMADWNCDGFLSQAEADMAKLELYPEANGSMEWGSSTLEALSNEHVRLFDGVRPPVLGGKLEPAGCRSDKIYDLTQAQIVLGRAVATYLYKDSVDLMESALEAKQSAENRGDYAASRRHGAAADKYAEDIQTAKTAFAAYNAQSGYSNVDDYFLSYEYSTIRRFVTSMNMDGLRAIVDTPADIQSRK